MPRNSTAWAAVCAAVMLMLSGCRFFGIDTRPEIRYVTESQRKNVAEPMYSMPVAGTGLFKQWPMRLGPDYGYAPWERRPAAGPVPLAEALPPDAADTTGPAATTTRAAPDGSTPKAVGATGSASAAASSKPLRPSDRATPRLATGELAEAVSEATDGATDAGATGAAQTASHATHLVVDDFDVPPAARGTLDFRTPAPATSTLPPATARAATSAAPGWPPGAASAVLQPAPSRAATRLPSEKNLAWLPADDGYAAAADARANASTAPHAAAASGAPSIALQQPGVFSARKVSAQTTQRNDSASAAASRPAATSSRNVLRDEAVQPAAATMPLDRPPAAPRQGVQRVPSELIPPSEDTTYELPSDPELGASSSFSPPVLAARSGNAAGATVVRPQDDGDDEELVFVTASDMGPAASAPSNGSVAPAAREYVNPHYAPSAASTYRATGYDTSEAGYATPRSSVLGELEAAKRALVP